ncbi:MAG TPA: hypothetical protein VI389_02960 [Geobacteraceae bacterium]
MTRRIFFMFVTPGDGVDLFSGLATSGPKAPSPDNGFHLCGFTKDIFGAGKTTVNHRAKNSVKAGGMCGLIGVFPLKINTIQQDSDFTMVLH